MSFPKNQDFATDDPAQLRADLQLEHESVRDELARIGRDNAYRWIPENVGTSGTVRAQPFGLYAGDTFTVMTPGKPLSDNVFRVLTNGVGAGVSILSDDGTSINGNPGFDSLGGVSGCREYQFVESPNAALRGWFRVGV